MDILHQAQLQILDSHFLQNIESLKNKQNTHKPHTLFDILLNPPKGYKNTMLLTSLYHNAIGALRIEILQSTKAGFGKKSYLKILAHSIDSQQDIHMVLFHPKPFMYKHFGIGGQCVVYGKLEQKGNVYTMIQPKIISEFDCITMDFKTTAHKNKILNTIAQHYVLPQFMEQCAIPKLYASHLYEIFHPTQNFIESFYANGGYYGTYLEALKFVEIYHHILQLRTKRLIFQANFVCNGDYKTFIKSLPFNLTQGQHQAIESIAKDLASPTAARRLIMGDVGCGKTIVILGAVMMAYPKKSILMAPTSILAKQLYEEAKNFLPSFVNLKLITSQSKEYKSLDSGLFNDETHFIIGTQAILHRAFDVQNFALVMSDEQHRFGTNQRHQLEKMFSTPAKSKPHALQFSATPIPRTMAMMNAHYIKQSIIKDLPFKKDISTYIITKANFAQLLAHLHQEFNKNHQAIIVYPLVEESEHIDYLSLSQGQDFWFKHFSGVYVTSGKDKQKQEVLEEFAKKGNLLLATTVIEVGISLPKLSTIVIVAPERLGLATLHQLRGRVSRNGLKGYCFLYTSSQDTKRLESFAKTLNGFEIAELDLQNRSSGDLLSGIKQSGNEFKFFNMSSDIHIINAVNAAIHSKGIE